MFGIMVKIRTLSLGLVMLMPIIIIPNVRGTIENPILSSYDFLYNEGIESYIQKNWEDCIQNFEMAIEDWHWWRNNIIRCRRKCAEEGGKGHFFSSRLPKEDKFFEQAVRSTLCLVKCKKEIFGSRMDRVVEGHIDEDFDIKKPYDYLQLCYYKIGKLTEAADAAATVISEQPEHDIMKENLRLYLAEGQIKFGTIKNRELKDYGKLYILGNTDYNDKDYAAMIRHMEESLKLYYEAYDDCRHLCENPFAQDGFSDFISSIANHYTYTLRCKRKCVLQLSNLFGQEIENYYSSYFNYLQYSYYQEGDIEKACEAVASVLTMDPNDELQLRNKLFYLQGIDVTEADFVPRKDVVKYKKRLDYEEKMMDFIEKNFVFLEDENILDDVEQDVKKLKGEATFESRISLGINSSSLKGELDITTIILESEKNVKDEL